MKKVKYRIIFEDEIILKDGLSDKEIRDEIAKEFYERDCDAFDAKHLEWKEVPQCQ